MPRTRFYLAAVAALIMAFGALGVVMRSPQSASALTLHGIGLAKGCNSPIVIGQLYTCDVLTINNVDTAGDTLTITSIVDVVHAGAGDQTSSNLLPGLSLTFAGGAFCGPGQLICTLPAGGSITTATPYGFYVALATDPNPLTDTIHLTWQDLCTSLAPNCPIGDQFATAGSSAVLQSPTPTATLTSTATLTATATATNTATPTATVNTSTITPVTTVTPPSQQKSCDPAESATNVGPGPSCNLFICQVGSCAGAGEGDLIVIEHVDNVQTNPITLGLGAYEFQVEFDSLVIQSVNPTDIIFTAGCGAPNCGTAPSSTNGFAALGRGAPDCTMTILFENSVRFGCVTHGQNAGPLGSFDLAKLDLIPSADDVKDLFPGNDNGMPTLIKDNECELADTLGHPVVGSVNGAGLLSKCGDIYVTVRILEGDLNLDCSVGLSDEAIIAQHYGSFFGSALYEKWYDLEPKFHDLDIDIKDLQKVFGREGSTCQSPIPAQTPVVPPAGWDLST